MFAFSQIKPDLYDRVFVLGPSHGTPIPCCTIAAATTAETPFGEIPFDTAAAETLVRDFPSLFTRLDIETAAVEHSLEMEFPLLKFVFGDKRFKIVPIMVGCIGPARCRDVADALAQFVEPRTLFVISSDFCHWGERFRYTYLPDVPGEIWERIQRLDKEGAEAIATGKAERFEEYLARTKNTICGRHPILILLNLIQGLRIDWPQYSQSSKATSKRDSSVSYFAGVARTD
jgi:AmmeMemoRadiSam system protein B